MGDNKGTECSQIIQQDQNQVWFMTKTLQRHCLFLPNLPSLHSSRIARARRPLVLVALGRMDQELNQRCTYLLKTARRHMLLVRQQGQQMHTLSVVAIRTTPKRAAQTHLHSSLLGVFLRPNHFSVQFHLASTTLTATKLTRKKAVRTAAAKIHQDILPRRSPPSHLQRLSAQYLQDSTMPRTNPLHSLK